MTMTQVFEAMVVAGAPPKLVAQAEREQSGKDLTLTPRYFIAGGRQTYFADTDVYSRKPGYVVIDIDRIRVECP